MRYFHRWMVVGAALLGAAPLTAQLAQSAAKRTAAHSPPFREVVNLPTFMEHVLSPAADIVWRASGTLADASGEHDLTPNTETQWELVVSGAATLAEASNALMIPQRARDDSWGSFAAGLGAAAESAYRAAEAHDPQGIAQAGERIDAACTQCHKHYGVE